MPSGHHILARFGNLGRNVRAKESVMKCTICKTGEAHPGTTTVTLQRDNSVVVIRDVPAEICENCGEYYLSEPTASRVYADADATAKRHVEVEIQRYAA
jgi:YgiT-type zinc finger domain-containing protein